MKYILSVCYLFIAVSAMILIKLGNREGGSLFFSVPVFNLNINRLSITGYLCYGISFLLFSVIISRYNVSTMLPVLAACNSVITIFAGVFIFKEVLCQRQIAGLILIILGTVLVGLRK